MAATAFQRFNVWYFDSGASHYMTAHSEPFTVCQAICPEPVSIANGESISATAAGTACIAVIGDSGVVCVNLNGALHAPELKTNLISVLHLLRQGLAVTFRDNAVVVLDKQQHVLARGVKEHGLFRLVQPPVADYSSGAPIYAFAALSAPSLSTWHQRFGHLSQQAIRWLASSRLVGGLELESGGREHLCDACAAGKASGILCRLHKESHTSQSYQQRPRASMVWQGSWCCSFAPIWLQDMEIRCRAPPARCEACALRSSSHLCGIQR
jgi:hypothetical protein